MNKRFTFSMMGAGLAAVAGLMLINTPTANTYSPRGGSLQDPTGRLEYVSAMRNNPLTGTVSAEEFNSAFEQFKDVQRAKLKADWPIEWEFAGPDNIAGVVRTILVDREDPNVLFAGAGGGAIFRSDNKGGSWYPVQMDNNGFGVISMAQTNDNVIYAGTGDDFVPTRNPGQKGSLFRGSGIYKSTDGETFEHISGTENFGYVTSLAAHPTNNWILAGTQTGLRITTDGGDNWTTLRFGACKDVKVNKNGVVLAYIISSLWRSEVANDAGSYSLVTGPSAGGTLGRMVIGWSESDPSYAYIATAEPITTANWSSSSGLTGLWRSTDAGASFSKVVEHGSDYFEPFTQGGRGQAWHDMCIGVHPRDKDRVFIGGIGFAEWSASKGPKMVGNNFNHPTNPFGIHADKHVIVFDNSGDDPIMYVGSDGGVSWTTNKTLDRYADRTVNFTSTQLYFMAANPLGEVMGATQDNGCPLVRTESFPRKIGFDMMGTLATADGFGCAMSQYRPEVMFGMTQQAGLGRSVDGGQNALRMWDNRIKSDFTGSSSFPNNGNNGFATGLHLWENMDAVENRQLYGDSSKWDEEYQSRLFLYLDNGTWMANNATGSPFNAENPTDDAVRWFKISPALSGRAFHFATSRDGDALFAASGNGRLYRITGLNKANWDTTELSDLQISDSLTRTELMGNSNINITGRFISDVSVDPTDANRVVICLGNYGFSNRVYITENALDAQPTWTDITSNLPAIPAYSVLISADDPSVIFLGTEYGMFATNNGYSSNPSWVVAHDGVDPNMPFPLAPVFDIVQSSSKPWEGHKVYAATHGMGMYKTGSMLSHVKEEVKREERGELLVYPNPAGSAFKAQTQIRGSYTLRLYALNGQVILTQEGRSNGLIEVNTQNVSNGHYFVEVIGDHQKAVGKLIIKH